MSFIQYVWDDPGDRNGNVQHIAEHGLTMEEVEYVLDNPLSEAKSQSSGLDCRFGYTPAGEYIIVVYELIDEDSLYPLQPI